MRFAVLDTMWERHPRLSSRIGASISSSAVMKLRSWVNSLQGKMKPTPAQKGPKGKRKSIARTLNDKDDAGWEKLAKQEIIFRSKFVDLKKQAKKHEKKAQRNISTKL